MAMVYIQLNDSLVAYEVKHEVDGIYKATLAHKSRHLSYKHPEKVILLRAGGGGFLIAQLKK